MNNEAVQLVIAVSEAIVAIAVVGGALLALVKGRATYEHVVGTMSDRLAKIEKQLEKQTEILADQRADRERMNGIDRRVELLEDRTFETERRIKHRVAEGMASAGR